MQTPEEVAREALGNIAAPLRRIFRGSEHAEWLDALDVLIAQEVEQLTDLIRARDAEVRDAERAKVLAGFEWEERGELGACTHPHHVHDVTGVAAWSSSECHHKFEADARRLVGPWEPTP